MNEFLAMGGYASYVWSAWGITLLVLVLNAWSARRRHARTLADAKQMTEAVRNPRSPTVRRTS